jgi:hypothetical protein
VPGTRTIGGYQPPTQPAERRAFFDLLRRVAELERVVGDLGTTVTEMDRVVDILAAEVTVSSYAAFSFNAATTEPIVGNQIRINNASQTAATRVWISHTTFDGLDVRVGLSRIQPGDLIYIQDFDDGSKWVRYTVVSSTNDGTYHDFTVTYANGPGNVPFQKIAMRIVFPGIS